jgi:hypothetical protein
MMRRVIGIRRGRGLAASLVEAQIGLTAKGKAEEGSWKEIGVVVGTEEIPRKVELGVIKVSHPHL